MNIRSGASSPTAAGAPPSSRPAASLLPTQRQQQHQPLQDDAARKAQEAAYKRNYRAEQQRQVEDLRCRLEDVLAASAGPSSSAQQQQQQTQQQQQQEKLRQAEHRAKEAARLREYRARLKEAQAAANVQLQGPGSSSGAGPSGTGQQPQGQRQQTERQAKEAARKRDRRVTQQEERTARRTAQLQRLMRDANSSSSGEEGDDGPAAAAGSAYPSGRPWLLMDALKKNLHYDYRRRDNPLRPKMGPFIESEATKDWPQRQQDLAPGQPLNEIPFSVHVDHAVKLAHAANHYMPDSVCACCSEMKAPAEYTLMPWHERFDLLRADVPRTNAVIRPGCVLHERSVTREQYKPPPDPVLPVGFTRYTYNAWVKQRHTLPFDQPDAPPKTAAAAAAQQQQAQRRQQGPGGTTAGGAAAAPAAATAAGPATAAAGHRDVDMRDQEETGSSSDDGKACLVCGGGCVRGVVVGFVLSFEHRSPCRTAHWSIAHDAPTDLPSVPMLTCRWCGDGSGSRGRGGLRTAP